MRQPYVGCRPLRKPMASARYWTVQQGDTGRFYVYLSSQRIRGAALADNFYEDPSGSYLRASELRRLSHSLRGLGEWLRAAVISQLQRLDLGAAGAG